MNSKTRGLGKGLDALFNQSSESTTDQSADEEYLQIPIDQIEPNPMQPRKNINDSDLEDLTRSIQDQGLLQPILVRKNQDQLINYQIIAGERRWRACKKCSHQTIPALVADLSDTDTLIFGLIENLQREDLNPVEEAEALYHLYGQCHLSQEDISHKIGRSRSSIANSLRLLQLDQDTKEALRNGFIGSGQARTILGIEDTDARLKILQILLSRSMTVRELEKIVSYWKQYGKLPGNIDSTKTQDKKQETTEFEPMKNRLKEKIATHYQANVQIRGEKQKGRISFVYNSESELYNILQQLGIDDPTVSRET